MIEPDPVIGAEFTFTKGEARNIILVRSCKYSINNISPEI